jgi:predicted RNase H-like HicB family nuclease
MTDRDASSEHVTRQYRLNLHTEADHVWAEVEELPGCFASGRDIAELREALAEAIGMVLGEVVESVELEPMQPAVQRVPAQVHLAAA